VNGTFTRGVVEVTNPDASMAPLTTLIWFTCKVHTAGTACTVHGTCVFSGELAVRALAGDPSSPMKPTPTVVISTAPSRVCREGVHRHAPLNPRSTAAQEHARNPLTSTPGLLHSFNGHGLEGVKTQSRLCAPSSYFRRPRPSAIGAPAATLPAPDLRNVLPRHDVHDAPRWLGVDVACLPYGSGE
jgi:hypothetical protein